MDGRGKKDGRYGAVGPSIYASIRLAQWQKEITALVLHADPAELSSLFHE